MRLTVTDDWTDAEWSIATDVHHSLRAGGPLSLRERQLEHVCGSAERALQVLAAVARAERHLQAVLEVRDTAPVFNLRPVPSPTRSSSQVTRPARRTATARAGRAELLLGATATAVVGLAPVITAINCFRGGN